VKPNHALAAITAVAYSPDGKKLAVGTFGEVVVYDTETWQQSAIFKQVSDAVRTLAFGPDNQSLAIGAGLPGRTGQSIIWDISGAQKPKTFPDQFDTIESVAFEKSGKSLLIGADDNKVRYVSDTSAGKSTVLDSHNGRVQAVAFSPKENSIFITGAMDRIVKVWDLKTVRNVVNFDQSEGGITGLAFLNNGDQFVGSSLDGRLYWWGVGYDQKKDAYNGYHFRTIGAHNGPVYCLSRSADGSRIVTGGGDHAICIWDINNGGQIRAFRDVTTQPIYAAALNTNGKIAAAGGREGLLYILDVEANKLITTLVPPVAAPPPSEAPARAAAPAKRKKHK
jgi:WD40 repeat protein